MHDADVIEDEGPFLRRRVAVLLQLKLIASKEGEITESEAAAAGVDDAALASPQGDTGEDDSSAPMSIVRQQAPSSASRFRPSDMTGLQQQTCAGTVAGTEGWGSLLSFLTNQDPSVVSSCQKPRGVMRR